MDESFPEASAVAVRGGKILAVGTDAEIRQFAGEDTKLVALEGRTLIPGLSDAHCHLYGLGKSLEALNLRGAASASAVAKMVASEISRKGDEEEWITGRGWDQNLWEGQTFPTRELLDGVAKERPVALRRVDGHALWANTEALLRAGIDKDTPDPEGGKIVRDEAGNATGILIDNAIDLVESKIPPASVATIRRRILAAAKQAAEAGITSVHEMGISDEVGLVYQSLADEGRLKVRVYALLAGNMEIAKNLSQRVPETDRDGQEFYVMRAMKLFADGALGSRGAALLSEYADDAGNTGLWLTSAEDLKLAARAAAAAGWQLAVHAIGDAGNRAVLDAIADAKKLHPESDLRFRVEHAQILAPDDIPRFAELGAIASMQPTHATSDMPWAEDRLGAERMIGAYAWRTLLDSGAHIAAGSDFPVEGVPPLLGIYSAVTRQDREGKPEGGWRASERMSLHEVLAAFTREAAYASFVEEFRGQIKVGMVADLTLFDRELTSDAASLRDAKVDMTIVGGVTTFERKH